MRVQFKAALMLGVASTLFTASLLTANAADPAPVANDDSFTCLVTDMGSGRYMDVRGNDIGTDLKITSVGPAQHGTVETDDGAFNVIYTANDGFLGVDTFPYTVTDANGQSASATVTVTVTNSFMATDDNVNLFITPDMPSWPIDVLANDVGTGLLVTAVSPAQHGQVIIGDGGADVVYTPDDGYFGADQFTYTATDADQETSTATVTIGVTSTLTAADDSATTPQDTTVEITVFANDEGYDNATIESVSAPANGTAAPSVCSGATTQQKLCVTYTPASGYVGTDSFSYSLRDDSGNATGATVTVTVTPVQATDGQTPAATVGTSGTSSSSVPMALVFGGVIVVAGAVTAVLARAQMKRR